MADNCIFCKIISGVIPCYKVYEDETTLAFLDINPVANGHTLVLTKSHCPRIQDMTTEQAAAFMQTAQRVATAVAAATGNEDANIIINNGPNAGQEIPHAHIHVIPRSAGDKLLTFPGKHGSASEELRAEIAKHI